MEKIIVADCDGVLLNWEYAFCIWLEAKGYTQLPDGNKEYNLAKRFGISGNKRKTIKCYDVDNYTNSLYLRFEVKDKPGVLSKITNRLAKYKISVKRLIQTPNKKNNKATVVIITHKANELNSKNCLSIFKKDKDILKYPTLIRIHN